MQNKFRFHIIVKVMDAFWNGKISIGIEFYIIADTRHCLYIDPQMYKFAINI